MRRLLSRGGERRSRLACAGFSAGVFFLVVAAAFMLFRQAEEADVTRGEELTREGRVFSTEPVEKGVMEGVVDRETRASFSVENGLDLVDPFLGDVAERIGGAGSPSEVLELIDELRHFLRASEHSSAASDLIGFLESGRDIPTGLWFTVRPDGFLDGAPNFRVILLDELERLSPEAGAEYARTILESPDSADEWAIALRSLGRSLLPSELGSDSYFTEKVDELLHRQSWLLEPSVGFLQAFDAVVYHGGTRFVPRLAEMLAEEVSPAVKYGAGLALDRLVMNDYAPVVAEIQAMDVDRWKGLEEDRARLFARADMRDDTHRLLVETYLLNSGLSSGEVVVFGQSFPNYDVEISNNLFSGQDLESFPVLLAKDRAALEAVREWRGDPRFHFRREVIDVIESRLEEFVASGERGLE